MNCDDARILVHLLPDGELSAAEEAAVRSHVQSCEACAALLQEVEVLVATIRRLPGAEEAPRSLRVAVERRLQGDRGTPILRRMPWISVLASAAAVVLMVLLYRAPWRGHVAPAEETVAILSAEAGDDGPAPLGSDPVAVERESAAGKLLEEARYSSPRDPPAPAEEGKSQDLRPAEDSYAQEPVARESSRGASRNLPRDREARQRDATADGEMTAAAGPVLVEGSIREQAADEPIDAVVRRVREDLADRAASGSLQSEFAKEKNQAQDAADGPPVDEPAAVLQLRPLDGGAAIRPEVQVEGWVHRRLRVERAASDSGDLRKAERTSEAAVRPLDLIVVEVDAESLPRLKARVAEQGYSLEHLSYGELVNGLSPEPPAAGRPGVGELRKKAVQGATARVGRWSVLLVLPTPEPVRDPKDP